MKKSISIIKELLLEKKLMLLSLSGLIGLLTVYIIYLLESIDMEAMEEFFNNFPEAMREFFGESIQLSNPYGFLSIEIFEFMWLWAGIYLVYMGSTILSSEIEQKTIDQSLSKPITRISFIGSKIGFIYSYILLLMFITFLIIMAGITSSPTFQNIGFYWERLWLTYIIVVLYLGSLVMFSFLSSTFFMNTRKSMAAGVIFLFLMFFIGSFYKYMGENIQNVKYLSIFFYYNPSEYLVLANFEQFIIDLFVLGSINIVFIVVSLIIFSRKDIPI
jgi:ABC-2 type transport system permease protein